MATAALLAGALALAAARVAADEPPRSATAGEDAVKAALAYNVLKFITWPERKGAQPRASLVLCVLGDDAFAAAVAPLDGKDVGTRPLRVRRVSSDAELPDCDAAFLGTRSGLATLAALADELSARGVLTFSSLPGAAEAGVLVNFVVEDAHVVIEVNAAKAQASGLQFSSKVLKLARVVRGGAPNTAGLR